MGLGLFFLASLKKPTLSLLSGFFLWEKGEATLSLRPSSLKKKAKLKKKAGCDKKNFLSQNQNRKDLGFVRERRDKVPTFLG
jgi:hypothetical protein